MLAKRHGSALILLVLPALACQAGDRDETANPGFGTGAEDDDGGGPGGGGDGGDDDGSDDDGGGGAMFDVGGGDGGGATECTVGDDMDGLGPCEEQAPPMSFEPDVQWTWSVADEPSSMVTPLVANLTDDDGDGRISLCDTPDIVVVAYTYVEWPAHVYVLDGASGSLHFKVPHAAMALVTPAIGDIDDDGVPEIVAGTDDGKLMALEHDGTRIWTGDSVWFGVHTADAIALADLDNDGDVEILAKNRVADHTGATLWTAPENAGAWSATAAADLDGDGDLEVVLGNAAYHHDGSPLFTTAIKGGYPQIADLDADGEPEVLVTNEDGISMLEHDGTIKYEGLRPTGDPVGWTTWLRPATVHDFDGDTRAEFALSSANHYATYEGDASILWSADVSDQTGIAAGTAFDFLGDGVAEAMYADEQTMFVFDGAGSSLLQIGRTSATSTEYPVVADVDNDGSAEIVVVSNEFYGLSPAVQVIRDRLDRWVPARRIWNQHTYHVTNVREDGTIPQHEPPHWTRLNTFRTQAQMEGGGVCNPEPEG